MWEVPITVTVAIRNGGLELLPHWVCHYAQQCRPCRLRLTILGGLDRQAEIHRLVSACGVGPDVVCSIRPVNDGFVEGHREQVHSLDEMRMDRSHWVVWTDLDELVTCGEQTIRQAVEQADMDGRSALFGQFVDHTARDGSLPPVLPTPSLFDQFPVESDLSKRVLLAFDEKVVAARWGTTVTGGHHQTVEYRREPPYFAVHHFKWHAAMKERLRAWYTAAMGCPQWLEECSRLDEHLQANHGKIRV